MNRKSLILCLLPLLVLFSLAHAQDTETEEESTITIYEYLEPFFDLPFYIDTLTARASFRFRQHTDITRCYYFDHGPFRCHFFAEPGKDYRIYLPDDSRLDPKWKKDPYFTPLPYHVLVKDQQADSIKGINEAIRNFDKEYEPFLSRLTLRYYQPESARMKLDSFVMANYQQDRFISPYFYEYKEYKKAILYYHLFQQNQDSLINIYLENRPVRSNNPAYRTLFSLLLSNYFDYLKRTEDFRDVFQVFRRFSMSELTNYLQDDPLMENDTILNLVLLKECFNSFYSGTAPKARLIDFIDSINQNTSIETISVVSQEIMRKFTYLRPGFKAPEFKAISVDGDTVNLSGSHEQLIYLGFCDLRNLQCLQEIEYLKYLSRKHGIFIKAISLLQAQKPELLEYLAEKASGNWEIISWKSNPEIAELYEIRGIPMFFLIDRDGKIIWNPAPNPSENFEQKLFELLRSRGEI